MRVLSPAYLGNLTEERNETRLLLAVYSQSLDGDYFFLTS